MVKIPITSWLTTRNVWIDPKKELAYDIQQGAYDGKYPEGAR